MKGWLAGALAASTLALATPSGATTALPTRPGFDTLSGCPSVALTPCWKPWDATNPFPVTGTFTASFSGFQPTPAYSQLAVGASSTRVALPTGTVVIVYNTGANAASVTFGNASVVATGANDIIQPNSWVAFTVGPNVDIAGIEATGAAGTTSLVISGGSGLPTGAGGGGGGGGSGGGGPLGVQAISNSQAVNPATSSVWAASQSGTWTVQPGNTPNTTAWLVTGAGGTFPATESGTWTVQPGNTPNTTAWLVTGAGGTFPATESGTWNITNISGTVSLPTNAATATAQASQQTSLTSIAANTPPAANVTHTQCDGTITTGGTAKVAIAAQTTLHGFTITNNDSTSGGGEPLWISLTTTAVGGGGTGSSPLPAPTAISYNGMGSITLTTGLNHAISVVAATSGHTYGCFWW